MSEKKYQIFISSTYEDLKEERDAAIKTILSLGHLPIGMEMFNAGDDAQWTVIERTINSSDYYVLIIGLRYGSLTDTGISYTEKEYNYAVSKGIPVLTFIKDESTASTPAQRESDVDKQQKLSEFREKSKKKIANFWGTKDEFTSVLSPSLYAAFTQTPRTGWISAGFDPMVMSQEIATLSKENRELREQLTLLETRKPKLVFSLECEENLYYTYNRPQSFMRQELSDEDITQELIDYLESQDRIVETHTEELGKLFSEQKNTFQNDDGDENVVVIDSTKVDYQQKLAEKISVYNKALPTQKEYDTYNKANARYVNMTENRHKAQIVVENSGTLMANQVTISLRFPPELLVFDDYYIEKTDKPKMLTLPKNPLRVPLEGRLPKSLARAVSAVQAYMYPPDSSRLALTSRLINGTPNNYYITDEDYLCYKKEKLLHTQRYGSHDFYIVATKKGAFEIEAELICEEISEPITKKITVIVE